MEGIDILSREAGSVGLQGFAEAETWVTVTHFAPSEKVHREMPPTC